MSELSVDPAQIEKTYCDTGLGALCQKRPTPCPLPEGKGIKVGKQ